VKRLALAAVLLSVLGPPALARAELVPGSAGARDSLLAVAADGTPRVAYVAVDGSIVVSRRSEAGTWSSQTVQSASASAVALVGLEAGPKGAVLLIEAADGGRLSLAEESATRWRVRTLATAPRKGSLGFGGLALDGAGRPLVAYAYRLSTGNSWLRLVHEDAAGRLVAEGVTQKGFPPTDVLPTAVPVVMPSGAVRVVEAVSGAAIEWSRTKSKKGWTGQFLFANSISSPAGLIRAVPGTTGLWSAWTSLYPTFGESHVLLTMHANGERTSVLHRHAFLVGLAMTGSGPVVAADDYVEVDGRTVFAGLLLGSDGSAVELAAKLQGYAAGQLVLAGPPGLDWYRPAVAPAASVTVAAAVSGASFVVSGQVSHPAAAASVELWRETRSGSELAGTLPLAADGTFSVTDLPPSRPLTYRVVYRDPSSGLPLAALVRTALGV
jgi:hypothetical protein